MAVESFIAPADFRSGEHTGPWPPRIGDLLHVWTWGKTGVHIKVVRRRLSQRDRDEIDEILKGCDYEFCHACGFTEDCK
jgi:hypothetical protein